MLEMCNHDRQNSVDIVKFLITCAADVNLRSKGGRTALMFACQQPSPISVDLLIEAGTNLDLQSRAGLTALMIACQCQCPSNENIELLIQAGADVNARSKYGITALMYYCMECQFTTSDLSTLMLLIYKTRDIAAPDNNNKTAYEYFKENPTHVHALTSEECIEPLLKGEIKIRNIKSARLHM